MTTQKPAVSLPYRNRRGLSALALAVALSLTTFAQSGGRSNFLGGAGGPEFPNFDIRTHKADPAWEGKADAAEYLEKFATEASARQDLAVSRVTGVALLEAAYPGVSVENSPTLGTTELVTAPGTSFLTGPSSNRERTLREFLGAHAQAYGLTDAQVGELRVVADYMNPAGNMGFAEFEQRFNDIPVFQGYVRGGFTAKGELVRTTGILASGIDPASLSTTPSLSAAQATAEAAETVGLSEAQATDLPASLAYFPLAEGSARLSWVTHVSRGSDMFMTLIDAETGTMLFRKNLTEYQTQSATYRVYPSDSPAPYSPSPATPDNNLQAPFVSRQTFTLIGNEAPNTFNNLGWITDGANITDGNNVEAGIDRDGVNGVDAPVTGTPNRVFNFTYDPQVDNPLTVAFQNGDVSNMFFWVNRYHDWTYLLGFTEAARNFQNDNFGRGGLGADRVSAEGQDSSGFNNANFATPADGGRGRMQMYIWTGPAPDRSGDLDQDVIFHELTHGLSNRLHGNASGLSTNMARGMGEGWSDFYARALLSTADEDVNGIYTVGGYVTNLATAGFNANYYYGIRRFPYAPRAVTGGPMNRPHSPLTFGDIDSTQASLADGAYPPGPFGTPNNFDQVHNIGEVWGGMLWEVRARFITRLGHAAGNQRILQFVTDGMKLDPVGPTLIQARDAIIAAANAGGGTADDIADIWRGFATRGLGVLAQVTNAGTGGNNTRVVESFLAPTDPVPTFSVNDVTAVEGNAGGTTFAFTVSLANPVPSVEHRVSFATADGTANSAVVTSTFTSAGPITFNDNATATPYPATVSVSGVTGSLATLAVRFNSISHTFPGDLDMFLVAPSGQRMVIQSDAGGTGDIVNLTYTLDDSAASQLSTSQITAGSFRPYSFADDDVFPTTGGTPPPVDCTPAGECPHPAPAGSSTLNGVFGGINPNGTWRLYVRDDASLDTGSMASYSLIIGVASPTADYAGASGQLVFPAGVTTMPINVTVNGDATGEPHETFFVNLSSPVNGVIGDGQGVGTILNDDAGGPSPTPTTVTDAFSTTYPSALNVAAPGVLGNDVNNGGSALTAQLVSNVSNGTLSLGANGSVSYTPNFGFAGTDSFTYRAVNNLGTGNVATVTINVAPPTNVQAPYNLRVDSVVGTLVTLRWDALAIGPQASTFVLEGGILPGQVLASIATNSPYPIFTFVAPPGSWSIRMHGQLGADKSAASNEVPLFVGVPVTPSAPTNLLGLVSGSTLNLTWKNTFGGGPPAAVVLDVTGSATVSLPMGPAESFAFSPVPGGNYTFSVREINAGGSSPASSPVSLSFPGGCTAAPGPPANFLGYRIGNTAFVIWDPPASGAAPTSYLLDVTGSFVGTFATPGRTLNGVVGPGSYNVRVQAVNACGASAFTPTQTIVVP